MSAIDSQVAQIYVALFGRAADAQGLAYWAGRMESGESLSHMADAMYATAPARAYFPDDAGDSDVLASFYASVLGRTADAQGLAYWTNRLAEPGETYGSIIAEMVKAVTHYSGTDAAGLASAQLFGNRAAASLFYAENGGSIENAAHVLDGINTDAQSVLSARMLVDDDVSGTVDLGGFSDVTLGITTGDVVLKNVTDTTTLHFSDTSHSMKIDALDTFEPAKLAITLPEGPFYDSSPYAWPNAADITLTGFSELDMFSATEAKQLVNLGGGHLDSIVVTGAGSITIFNSHNAGSESVDALLIDATGFVGTLDVALSDGATLEGGDGNDRLFGHADREAIVDGGAGDDLLGSDGTLTLVGGSGDDAFLPGKSFDGAFTTIADFQKGSDSLHMGELTPLPPPDGPIPIVLAYWVPQAISLSSNASYDAYLNAAAAMRTETAQHSTISWFQYGGDTYIVVDNSSATTFQQNADDVVKLVGQIDLSTLTYDTQSAILS